MKTKNLDLLLLQYNQSQKELVANEWFSTIDALFFRHAADFINEIPLNNTEEIYIVSKDAKGALSKHSGSIVFYLNGWRYLTPKEGFIFFIESYSDYFLFKNGYWDFLKKVEYITHSGGDLELNISKYRSFEITAHSDIRVSFSSTESIFGDINLKIFTDKDIKISWGDNVILSQNISAADIKKGGASFCIFYSKKHHCFVIEGVSYYLVR